MKDAIRRALERTEGQPNDVRAAAIEQYIEIYQELTGGIATKPFKAPAIGSMTVPGLTNRSTVTFSEPEPIPVVASVEQNDELIVLPGRIGTAPPPDAPRDYHTAEEIHNYLMRNTPEVMTVDTLVDGQAIQLAFQRRISMDGDAAVGTRAVRLEYNLNNGGKFIDGPRDIFLPGEEHLNLEDRFARMKHFAAHMFGEIKARTREAVPVTEINRAEAEKPDGSPASIYGTPNLGIDSRKYEAFMRESR
jgi:hypothetical protein